MAQPKSSQAEAVTIVVPVEHMPTASPALETWAETAGLKPGDAVFRPVDQRQIIGAARLTDRNVSRILKSRVRALLLLRGKMKAEADELVEGFSGHSMRAGCATTAAANDVSVFDMQRQTRHKSLATLTGYVREADKWKKNGLKGIGFLRLPIGDAITLAQLAASGRHPHRAVLKPTALSVPMATLVPRAAANLICACG